MRRPDLRVVGALLFVQATFGAFHVVGRGVLEVLPPLAVAGLRVAVAAPLLLVVAWRVDRIVPPRRELPSLALLGLLGVFANQLLYIVGLGMTTATNAAILMPSIPAFALMVAAGAGIERLTRRTVAGVGLAVAGAVVMLDPSRFAAGAGTTAGNLLVLANCLSYATYLVLQRPVLRRLPPLTVIAWAFLFGGAGVLAVTAPTLARLHPAAVPGAVWAGMAYIVLIPTAVNYALNTWAIRRSSPSLVAAFTTLQPVFTAALAVVFLGERPGVHELAGFLLIAAGLAAISGRRRGGAAPPPAPSSPPGRGESPRTARRG